VSGTNENEGIVRVDGGFTDWRAGFCDFGSPSRTDTEYGNDSRKTGRWIGGVETPNQPVTRVVGSSDELARL